MNMTMPSTPNPPGAPDSPETATTADPTLCALEAFPGVLKRIQSLWGTPDCDQFMQSLFMDSRGGTRRGFPVDAAAEIMYLIKFNKYVRALPLSQRMNIAIGEAVRIIDQGDLSDAQNNPWNDPSTSSEASARQRPTARENVKFQERPARKSGSSNIIVWVIILLLLGTAWWRYSPSFG
jgi:hypothetical protein